MKITIILDVKDTKDTKGLEESFKKWVKSVNGPEYRTAFWESLINDYSFRVEE